MIKRSVITFALVAMVFLGLRAAPASALSVSDIQEQIKVLLARIADLKAQIEALRASQSQIDTAVPAAAPAHRVCTLLARDLMAGSRGDDVTSLQEFLAEQGYLSAQATGYFGPATAHALAGWQSSQGVYAAGRLGPLTRERIKLWCGGPRACTLEYNPVCGAKPVVCIKAPCNPVPTTYGNRCAMQADGATFLYEGECHTDQQDPASDPQCKAWFDGCNTCTRSEPGGAAICTMRACMSSIYYPRCTSRFDGATPANQPPVISSFSGPTTLSVNETGTWRISASDPEGGTLSYAILWGDEYQLAQAAGRAMQELGFVQDTAFEHAYARAGTYTVAVTVRDSAGSATRATATVQVRDGGVACTKEYVPVCGRPPGCANTCPAGMYCAMLCQLHQPQTYANACQMRAAGAEFLYDGACTAPTPPPAGQGTLSGRISIGPICPVETEPPQPQCRPTPAMYASHAVFVYGSLPTGCAPAWCNKGRLMATLTPDGNGAFSVALAPGDYLVKIEGAYGCARTGAFDAATGEAFACSGIPGTNVPIELHVDAGATTAFSADIDTGIR